MSTLPHPLNSPSAKPDMILHVPLSNWPIRFNGVTLDAYMLEQPIRNASEAFAHLLLITYQLQGPPKKTLNAVWDAQCQKMKTIGEQWGRAIHDLRIDFTVDQAPPKKKTKKSAAKPHHADSVAPPYRDEALGGLDFFFEFLRLRTLDRSDSLFANNALTMGLVDVLCASGALDQIQTHPHAKRIGTGFQFLLEKFLMPTPAISKAIFKSPEHLHALFNFTNQQDYPFHRHQFVELCCQKPEIGPLLFCISSLHWASKSESYCNTHLQAHPLDRFSHFGALLGHMTEMVEEHSDFFAQCQKTLNFLTREDEEHVTLIGELPDIGRQEIFTYLDWPISSNTDDQALQQAKEPVYTALMTLFELCLQHHITPDPGQLFFKHNSYFDPEDEDLFVLHDKPDYFYKNSLSHDILQSFYYDSHVDASYGDLLGHMLEKSLQHGDSNLLRDKRGATLLKRLLQIGYEEEHFLNSEGEANLLSGQLIDFFKIIMDSGAALSSICSTEDDEINRVHPSDFKNSLLAHQESQTLLSHLNQSQQEEKIRKALAFYDAHHPAEPPQDLLHPLTDGTSVKAKKKSPRL